MMMYYNFRQLREQQTRKRGDGGIGRRAGFRCLWWQHRVGSSPILRIRVRYQLIPDFLCSNLNSFQIHISSISIFRLSRHSFFLLSQYKFFFQKSRAQCFYIDIKKKPLPLCSSILKDASTLLLASFFLLFFCQTDIHNPSLLLCRRAC